ncbi:MAG: hypothetical protein HUU02_13590 [Bacteroidetes bacterium]|nr:hypothetical protein [Bacteroidota bacterium]
MTERRALFRFILIGSLTVLLWGCPARSLHPLFTPEQSVNVAAIEGWWRTDGAEYRFEVLEGTNYKVTVISTEDQDTAMYAGQFGRVRGTLYLDTAPLSSSDEHHYLSVHLFSRIDLNGDSLTLRTLDGEWLVKLADNKQLRTPFVRRENEIILTGTPAELQSFVASAAAVADAYPDISRFVRLPVLR